MEAGVGTLVRDYVSFPTHQSLLAVPVIRTALCWRLSLEELNVGAAQAGETGGGEGVSRVSCWPDPAWRVG